jgi:hypothetical protein
MKRNLILVLILFTPVLVQAQFYKPLLREGNQWNFQYIPHQSQYKCGKYYSSDSTGTEILQLASDTDYNGITYRKLLASYDSLKGPGLLLGLMREDTASRKVFFIGMSELFLNIEIMLYDFSVKTNDTIRYVNSDAYGFSDIVVKLDSVEIGNALHKRVWLGNGAIWIEGIGALDGLVSSAMNLPLCGTIYTRTLLCFYQNNELVYQPDNSEYKECYYPVTGINSIIAQQMFSLKPNPAADFITINSAGDEYYSVELLNIQGQMLIEKTVFNQSEQINLTSLKPGIYFIRIFNKQGDFKYKFIKE